MNPRQLFANVLPPAGFGLLFLAGWEAVVKAFDLKPYFLPAPSAIWSAFTDNTDLVRSAAFASGSNALVGLIAGTLLGITVMPLTTDGGWYPSNGMMLLPPSAFFIIGLLIWVVRTWKTGQVEAPEHLSLEVHRTEVV